MLIITKRHSIRKSTHEFKRTNDRRWTQTLVLLTLEIYEAGEKDCFLICQQRQAQRTRRATQTNPPPVKRTSTLLLPGETATIRNQPECRRSGNGRFKHTTRNREIRSIDFVFLLSTTHLRLPALLRVPIKPILQHGHNSQVLAVATCRSAQTRRQNFVHTSQDESGDSRRGVQKTVEAAASSSDRNTPLLSVGAIRRQEAATVISRARCGRPERCSRRR